MGFLSEIKKSGVIEKSLSRLSLPGSSDNADYTIEDAINDHAKLFPVNTFEHHVTIFEQMDVEDDRNDGYEEIQREAYYNFIRRKAKKAASSSTVFVYSFMREVYQTFTDYRKTEAQIVYPLPLLIMVIMMAHNCGFTDAKDIVSYYRKHCLEFFILMPDVPPLTNQLSSSTVRTVMMLLSREALNAFFTEHFTKVKLYIKEQINFDKERIENRPDQIRNTIGFDGQALNSTFKRGESNRRIKGGDVVTLFDCTNRVALDYEIAEKKNNERRSVLNLFSAKIKDSVVMADALNSQKCVTDAILKNGADYLLPIKMNSNKELTLHVEAIFNRNHQRSIKNHKVEKNHGRIDEWYYEVLPAKGNLDPRIKNQHSKVRTLVKYAKISERIIDGKCVSRSNNTRYYISSLPYDENTIYQIRASIEDYWAIEAHHAVLDNPQVLNQDHLHLCDTNSIANATGFNKISHSFLSFLRQIISKSLNMSVPISFKETSRQLSEMDIFKHATCMAEYWFDQIDKSKEEL